MLRTVDQLKSVAAVALLVASVACGNHGSPTAPGGNGPSVDIGAAPTSVVTGATIVGTVSGAASTSAAHLRTLGMTGVTVTVVGTSVSAAVDFNGSFTVTNVPSIQVVLNLSGPGINASVPIGLLGADDHVQVAITISGTTATLDSLTSTSATGAAASMKGVIASLTGTCPTLSLVIGGTTVQTNGTTRFREKSCTDLAAGDTAGVVGTRTSTGIVIAISVDVPKPANIPSPAPPPISTAPVTITGTLGTFSGPCPTLSMLVGGSYVRTNASTTFSGTSCGDLKSGDVLNIVGSNTGDNLGLLASKVAVTGSAPVPPPVSVTLSGTISALAGPCPALSLKVAGTYVVTNASTTFGGRACGDLKVGDTVEVVGTHPADSGTVTATKVTAAAPTSPPPTSSTVTMNGTIGGVIGTCPALAMSLGTSYVRTNSATTFSGKACGELKAGDAIGVTGTKQTDGTILASLVTASR